MKHSLGISTLSVVCVMCATFASGAYGAASVRALGGAGTYNGSAAATAATSGASTANVGRAGSLRVAPSANRAGASVATTTKNGSAATSQRLSIGKYLGGSTSISGGSSTRPGTGVGGGTSSGGMDAGTVSELTRQVDDLYEQVKRLDSVDDKKQDKLSSGDEIIKIDGDEVSVDIVKLGKALEDTLDITAGQDGREIIIGSNKDELLWKYAGDDEWTVLISKSELVGPQGEKGEPGEPGAPADMDLYSTTAEMNDAISSAIVAAASNYALASDLALKADKTELAAKADKTDVYTKAEIEAKGYLTEHQSLADYAKSADVYSKDEVYTKAQVDTKVANVVAGDMDEALKAYAKAADLATVKQDVSDLTDYVDLVESSIDGKISGRASQKDLDTLTEYVANDMYSKTNADNKFATKEEIKNLATADDVLDVLETLDTKADKSDIPTKVSAFENDASYLVESDLNDYAKKSDIPTKVSELENDAGYATTTQLSLKADASDVDAIKTDLTTNYATINVLNETKTELSKEIEKAVAGDVTSVINNAVTEQLANIEITNEQIADNAEIAREKLATDVRTSLARADTVIETPDDNGAYVLFVNNGKKEWAEVVFEPTDAE